MPDLSITKQVSPSGDNPGQAITYTLTFTNQGTALSGGVIITDTMSKVQGAFPAFLVI